MIRASRAWQKVVEWQECQVKGQRKHCHKVNTGQFLSPSNDQRPWCYCEKVHKIFFQSLFVTQNHNRQNHVQNRAIFVHEVIIANNGGDNVRRIGELRCQGSLGPLLGYPRSCQNSFPTLTLLVVHLYNQLGLVVVPWPFYTSDISDVKIGHIWPYHVMHVCSIGMTDQFIPQGV